MKYLAILISIVFFNSNNLFAQKNIQYEYDDVYFSKSDRIKEKSASKQSLNSFKELIDLEEPSLSKFSNPDYDGGTPTDNSLNHGYYDENIAIYSYKNSEYNQNTTYNSDFNNFWNKPRWYLRFDSFGEWTLGFGNTALFNLGYNYGFNSSAYNNSCVNLNYSNPYSNSWRNIYSQRSTNLPEFIYSQQSYRGTRYSRNSLASERKAINNANMTMASVATKYVSRLNNRSSSGIMKKSNGRSSYPGLIRKYKNTERSLGINSGINFSQSNRRSNSSSTSNNSFSRSSSSSRSSVSKSSTRSVRRKR